MWARCNSSAEIVQTASQLIAFERRMSLEAVIMSPSSLIRSDGVCLIKCQLLQLGNHVEREIRTPGVAAVGGKAHFGEAYLVLIVA